ncbi:M36 family metallopeptidase [Actinoplanes sp. NPDC051470]|uniref:M4 family metallopeptidase n=1 Tax=unclassified Actinoplanes TaxID=2626549 RepID=UPI00343C3CEA
MNKLKAVVPLVIAGLVTAAAASPASAAPSLPDDLRQVQVRQSLLGTHTWYQQLYQGIPVLGGYYATHTEKNAKAPVVTDGRKQVTGLATRSAGISGDRAKSAVAGRLKRQPAGAQLMVVPGSPAKLAWVTLTASPGGTVRSVLDASSGALLKEERTIRHADGKGRVFDPNPVVKLQDESLDDQDDAAAAIPAKAYRNVTLTHLNRGKTTLQGAYANNISANAVTSPRRVYKFDRENDHFEEVMAYYSFTETQKYIHNLGFSDVNNEPQDFRTTGFEDDNSYYDDSDDSITFGTGGVDDAEDNEVIWHEYGHAIQADQVPDYGLSEEAGAIGEGFGDYWAVTMSQATSRDTRVTPWACVMDWDATSYTSDEPHCLRRTDGTKVYPADLDGEVHDDGEIWSRALWDINSSLGRRNANRVILEAHFYFPPDTDMPTAANLTVITARALYGAGAAAKVKAAFQNRGIL